jgi:hypothetical protein
MQATGAAPFTAADDALPGTPGRYERHRPEQTLLYQVIAQHYPTFLGRLTAEGRTLPRYVQGEFEAYLNMGSCECAAKSATERNSWPSAASAGVSARAAVRGAWSKAPPS